MEVVTEGLKSGDTISFTGFGKFSAAQRAARQGVNPRTGERVDIAATTVPKFTAGSHVKAALKTGDGRKREIARRAAATRPSVVQTSAEATTLPAGWRSQRSRSPTGSRPR